MPIDFGLDSKDEEEESTPISDFFFGKKKKYTPQDVNELSDPNPQGLEKLPLVGDYLLKHRLESAKNVKSGEEQPVLGPEMGSGIVKKPFDYLANRIDPADSRTDRGTIRPLIAGAVQGVGSLLDQGLDPRAVATEKPFVKPAPVETPPPPKVPLQLGPAPPSVERPPTFIAGERGVVPNKPQTIDIAPPTPALGAKDTGTILPREVEGLNTVPPEIAAQYSGSGTPRSTDVQIPNERTLPGDVGSPTEPTQPKYFTGEGHARPGEPQLPTAVKTKNQVFDKPPIDEAPVVDLPTKDVEPPIKVENKEVLPPGIAKAQEVPNPGNAKVSEDIGNIRAEYGSADKTLSSRPESKPIADVIVKANDDKMSWIATTERELADLTKGLSRSDRLVVGHLLDNFKNPAESQISPELAQRALQIRSKLNEIHELIPGGIKPGGENVGFIENYLTHIENQTPSDLKDGIKQVWEYHFKKPFSDMFGGTPLEGKGGGIGDMYGTGKGDPNSQFAKTRTGGLTNLEMDVNKVLPAYVESIAKLIYDKPAVDSAKKVLSTIPDSKLKELAGWYIKNYSRYDAMPGLSEGWNHWTQMLARTASRSMLGFSTGLQTLHLARIPANLWPELPTKYLALGAKEVGFNPVKAYGEAVRLGMLSNEIRPMAFKTFTQKVDSAIHLFSAADFLDRSIGYHGFKQMFIDQGLSAEQASAKAIAASKRASLMVDPARATMGFSSDAKVFGGAAGKLATQFKQVPTKIIEQYLQIAANAKIDPKAAARMVSGVGLAVAAYEEGLHTFHVSPGQFAVQTGGAVGGEVAKIARPNIAALYHVAQKLGEGDINGALETTSEYLTGDKFYDSAKEAGLLMVPGGLSLARQLKNGPSMFEKE